MTAFEYRDLLAGLEVPFMLGKRFFQSQSRFNGTSERRERSANVLVVDDVPDILDYFQGVFRRVRVPHELMVVADSRTALKHVTMAPFDLVISDFRMRGVTGVEILQKARKTNPDGLRVLMTGYNEIPATLEDIRAADVDAYVQKPLAAQELLLLILDLLNRNDSAIAELRRRAREVENVAQNESRMRSASFAGTG